MKNFSKWFSELSPAIQLALIAIMLFLIWRIYNWAAPMIANYAKKTEGQVLQSAGQVPTYSDYEYETIANNLEKAMRGIGTHNEDVFKEFAKLNNTLDFIKLEVAFGVRSGAYSLWGLVPPSDLTGWIQGDLNEDQIKYLNKLLANKGIKKSF